MSPDGSSVQEACIPCTTDMQQKQQSKNRKQGEGFLALPLRQFIVHRPAHVELLVCLAICVLFLGLMTSLIWPTVRSFNHAHSITQADALARESLTDLYAAAHPRTESSKFLTSSSSAPSFPFPAFAPAKEATITKTNYSSPTDAHASIAANTVPPKSHGILPAPPATKMFFPLAQAPLEPFTGGERQFGAIRDWGRRLHAGVDLLEYAGQPVFAITDGKIIEYHYFTSGTYAIVVDHHRFIIRYGEVRSMWSGLEVGDYVRGGQKIGIVGLHHGTYSTSMLHLEKYTGKASGPLSQYRPPYQRRRDLVNPTRFVQSLKGYWPQ